jgi:hypothetical protein
MDQYLTWLFIVALVGYSGFELIRWFRRRHRTERTTADGGGSANGDCRRADTSLGSDCDEAGADGGGGDCGGGDGGGGGD